MSDPSNRRHGRWALFAAVSIATVVLDLFTKAIVTRTLGPDGSRDTVELIPGILEFGYAQNTGVAFGLLGGGSWVVWIAVGVGLIAGGWFVATSMADASRSMTVALGFCVGGAIGNLIDRMARGFVVDFVEIGPWPSFNLADSALTIGLLLFIALQFTVDSRRSHPA